MKLQLIENLNLWFLNLIFSNLTFFFTDVPVVEVEYKYPNSLVSSNFRGSQNVSLSEGDSVIIRCKSDSNPPAKVKWAPGSVQ